MIPYLLDKEGLAEYLSIGHSTVEKRVANGMLPNGKMWGGKLMWRRADVDRHIDATFGLEPTEAQITEEVRRATRKVVNGR